MSASGSGAMIGSGQLQGLQPSFAPDKQRERQSLELAINLSGSSHSSNSSSSSKGAECDKETRS